MAELIDLEVTTHVGRDILSAASGFKSEASTVWEYVINSLQYVDDGILPKVHVLVLPKKRVIQISDNGSGMSRSDLSRFFQMHGENKDRLLGKPGRGKFGTGKSAAFGIGQKLTVDSRKNGLRNVVELTREAIEKSGGGAIPVRIIAIDEPTNEPNGTSITISEIFLRELKTAPVIDYIERNLQIFRAKKPEVAVNEHVCAYREPNVVKSFSFRPSPNALKILGEVELTIKLSAAPLEAAEIGVAITAGLGNLVAIDSGGLQHKEFGNYLFGEIDVPALETYETPMEPYDSTRSLQLNLQHPVCAQLVPFIGSKLEVVRRWQIDQFKEARKTEEARRLHAQAEVIAELLNKDFLSVFGKLNDIRAASAGAGHVSSTFGGAGEGADDESTWVRGIQLPGDVAQISKSDSDNSTSSETGRPDSRPAPDIEARGEPNENASHSVDPAGGKSGKRKRPRGGFSVDFRNLGEEQGRSRYDRTSLAILINLDHEAVKAAKKKWWNRR